MARAIAEISINLRLASFPSCPIKGKLEERKRPIG